MLDKKVHSIIANIFFLLRFIDIHRKSNRIVTWIVTFIPTIVIVYSGTFLYDKVFPNNSQKHTIARDYLISESGKHPEIKTLIKTLDSIPQTKFNDKSPFFDVWLGIKSLIAGLLVFIFMNWLLPMLFYVPVSIALRTLGVWEAYASENDSIDLLNKYISKNPKGKRIRVVCISGKHLFVESNVKGKNTPLHDHALRGDVDVIMPINSNYNKTISSRFDTYDENYKSSNNLSNVNDLVNQVKQGKDFLKKK